tara:strand:- start:13068 stop:13655 length:588 start_codon:yes stop_codon:yes gene_type:complete
MKMPSVNFIKQLEISWQMKGKKLKNSVLSAVVTGCATTTPGVLVKPAYVPPIVDGCEISKTISDRVEGHAVVYNHRLNQEKCENKTFGFVYLMNGNSWSHIAYGSADGRLAARVAGPFQGPVGTRTLLSEKSSIYECLVDEGRFNCEFNGKAKLTEYDGSKAMTSKIDAIGASIRSSTAAENANFGYELMSKLFK